MSLLFEGEPVLEIPDVDQVAETQPAEPRQEQMQGEIDAPFPLIVAAVVAATGIYYAVHRRRESRRQGQADAES